jgi:prevent-host-death family protein
MTMVMKRISASSFKARCLHLLDEVANTGEHIVVTKRGEPIARLVPVEEPPSLEGSVTYHVSDEQLIAPIDVDWDADRVK